MTHNQELALKAVIVGREKLTDLERMHLMDLLIELKSTVRYIGQYRVSIEVAKSIDHYLDQGQKVMAIKVLRGAFVGASLRDAKDAVDGYRPLTPRVAPRVGDIGHHGSDPASCG